ncbi:MAG TPA: hypothetical protein VG796_29085 [Verrucomicrobiales bacterium]|nr:hypothetical protein [Verrucomicrobiales bacterium]
MSAAFEEFRERLILDDGHRALLRESGARGGFFEEGPALAKEWGLEVTKEELEEAHRAGKRLWMERFL